MQNPKNDRLYAIQQIPGKGCGIVAIAKIAKGMRIISESPLFTVPRNWTSTKRLRASISEKVNALSKDQKKAFLSMHNAHAGGVDQYLGIVRTNALPLGVDAVRGGIFLDACRINHSCNPNGQNTWNENIKQVTIHAVKDIEKGEEITISYLSVYANHNSRQQSLRRGFGFTCSCDLCSLPLDLRRKSDERLDEIARLDGLIGDGVGILSTPLQTLHYAHTLLGLLNEEGMDDSNTPRTYYDALQIAVANGDLARASVFAERASSIRTVFEGDDSPEVIKLKRLARNPSEHVLYGMSMRWKTAVEQVPQGLGLDEFEDWLWKKEELRPVLCTVEYNVKG